MARSDYENIPELSADAKANARRRKIAESMLARSQQQLPANKMVGNVVAPLSVTQGLAKLLQAYTGQKQLGEADDADRELAGKRQQMVADAMSGVNKTAQGQSAVGEEGPQIPIEGDKRQAIMDALMSNLPEVQRYGQAMQGFEGMDAKASEAEAMREATASNQQANRDSRMEALKMQIESREKMGEQSNDLRAALANMQDETRRELAAQRGGGGGRAVKPVQVMGDDGNPVYVDAQDAIGRSPVQKRGKGSVSPEQLRSKQEAVAEKGKIIMNKVDEAMKELDFNTTGITGKLMSNIPGSDRKALEGALETIKANLGFEELQQMRNNSPTGGALGQVAVQELVALQSTVASLDPDMPTSTLKANLLQIKDKYKRIVNAIKTDIGGSSPRATAPSSTGKTPKEVADELINEM